MKPRRPSDFEVFDSNVKLAVSKSDSITEDVQKSRVPYKLDSYLGTSSSYFTDNGKRYIKSKGDMIFKLLSLPFRNNFYNRLQSSTYCKPYVKPGPSAAGDGNIKYYTSTSYSKGTVLGVERYLYTEIKNNKRIYYFIGDKKDSTKNGTKYYIKPEEVLNNYLVPFTMAILEDKIIYPIMVFLEGVFVPWSRCFFAVSNDEYKIFINIDNLSYNPNSTLIDRAKDNIMSGKSNPIFYVLPFDVNYV